MIIGLNRVLRCPAVTVTDCIANNELLCSTYLVDIRYKLHIPVLPARLDAAFFFCSE